MLKLILFVSLVSLINGAPAPHEHNPMEGIWINQFLLLYQLFLKWFTFKAGLFEGDIAGVDPVNNDYLF